jgi:Type I restriction modification DNA specificity domain
MKWPVVSLEDVLSLEYGAALPAVRRDSSGSIPVAGSNGVDGYHVKALVKGPGIVVGWKGSAGKVAWFDSDFWPIDTTLGAVLIWAPMARLAMLTVSNEDTTQLWVVSSFDL